MPIDLKSIRLLFRMRRPTLSYVFAQLFNLPANAIRLKLLDLEMSDVVLVWGVSISHNFRYSLNLNI